MHNKKALNMHRHCSLWDTLKHKLLSHATGFRGSHSEHFKLTRWIKAMRLNMMTSGNTASCTRHWRVTSVSRQRVGGWTGGGHWNVQFDGWTTVQLRLTLSLMLIPWLSSNRLNSPGSKQWPGKLRSVANPRVICDLWQKQHTDLNRKKKERKKERPFTYIIPRINQITSIYVNNTKNQSIRLQLLKQVKYLLLF